MFDYLDRTDYYKQYYQKNKVLCGKRSRLWEERNPEKRKRWWNAYYKKNRVKLLQNSANDRKKNREKIKKRMKNYTKKVRIAVRLKLFEILGGTKCIKCKNEDARVLQFDHKNGGGRKDRKKLGDASIKFYNYYVDHPKSAKSRLQVLCANCHVIKTIRSNFSTTRTIN